LLILLLSVFSHSYSQRAITQLNEYGIAQAFLGGIYEDGITISRLSEQGSYDIAAPFMLDGELIQIDDKIYQTHTNGKTGYRMPFYMLNISVAGYHAHFLSVGKNEGGHVLTYIEGPVLVEIALIKNVNLQVSQGSAFGNFKSK
jgi:alpha-acetolactate decarboxylase